MLFDGVLLDSHGEWYLALQFNDTPTISKRKGCWVKTCTIFRDPVVDDFVCIGIFANGRREQFHTVT